jgi:hypothetical protein
MPKFKNMSKVNISLKQRLGYVNMCTINFVTEIRFFFIMYFFLPLAKNVHCRGSTGSTWQLWVDNRAKQNQQQCRSTVSRSCNQRPSQSTDTCTVGVSAKPTKGSKLYWYNSVCLTLVFICTCTLTVIYIFTYIRKRGGST